MTWDDLTAEEREAVVGAGTDQPWPLTTGEWLGRWGDLLATVRALYPGRDTRKIEEAAWDELCCRYSNRPGV